MVKTKKYLYVIAAAGLFFSSIGFFLADAASLKEKHRDKDMLDKIIKVRWNATAEHISNVFGELNIEGRSGAYILGEVEGKEAVMFILFDQHRKKLAEMSLGLPLGDLSDEEIGRLFSALEQRLEKYYGRPSQRLRDNKAGRVMEGVTAYDLWERGQEEIILLWDMNSERIQEMVENIGSRFPDRIQFDKKRGNKAIGIIFRGPPSLMRGRRSGKKVN